MGFKLRGKLFLASQAYNLRALRLDKRLTQEQVAAKLNVSRSYYSEIERGARPRDIPLALRTVNRMRTRTDRTDGGDLKVGRELVSGFASRTSRRAR
jgi:transcriptional regulator with XRE-family HTH domain